MTDKDKIKFAIRYLKQGLKSKRTPPLYEELMKELGFVSEKELGKLEGKLADLTSEYYELENLKNNEIAELKDKLNNLSSVAEVRLANWQKYENAYNETQEPYRSFQSACLRVLEENNKLKRIVKMVAMINKGIYTDEGIKAIYAETEQFLKE